MYNYKNLLYIRPINNKYEVEYESYFNPHANPKQLMDKKIFDSLDEAMDWSNKYLHENYFDGEELVITKSDMQFSDSSIIVEDINIQFSPLRKII